MKPDTMTVDAYRALLALQDKQEGRKRTPRKKHAESEIQRSCVRWFREEFPGHALMLFAVPNGGGRSRVEGAILKGEGVTAGVSDLILLEARGGFGALCIEMKTRSKRSGQSDRQREWQAAAEAAGNRYVVARSLEAFKRAVYEYMGQPRTTRTLPLLRVQERHGPPWRDGLKESPEPGTKCRVKLVYDTYTATWNGQYWIDETGFRLCGVVEWKPLEKQR